MYCQLGDIVFQGLFSFHEYDRKAKKEYAQLPILKSKPDLQDVGTSLEQIEMSIRLHESYCEPAYRYEQLRDHCNNGDILPFIDGSGNVIGNFVIEDLSKSINQTDPLGAVTLCECKVVLLEWVDPNRALTRAQGAKRSAFALGAGAAMSLNVNGPISAPAVDIFASIKPLATGSSATIDQVSKASKSASTAAMYVGQALKSANNVVLAAQATQAKAQDYASQGLSISDSFITSNASVISNANNVITALRSGNIGSAVTSSNLLGQSVSQLNIAALPLQKILILR